MIEDKQKRIEDMMKQKKEEAENKVKADFKQAFIKVRNGLSNDELVDKIFVEEPMFKRAIQEKVHPSKFEKFLLDYAQRLFPK